MNKIEELIEQLCPDGVEFKKLGSAIKLEKGKQLNKELLSEIGEFPAYNGGISYSGYTDKYNYNENTIIISQGGASAGFVNFITTKFYANAHCYVVLPNIEVVENKFVYHFLKLNQEKLTEKQHGAGIPALRTSEILDLQIPLPPLPIQQVIVSILDKFTQLQAELEAELEARRAQYEYYKNELLNFEESDKWTELKEIVDFSQGIQVDISKQSPVKKDGFVRFLRIVDFVKDNEPPRYIKNPGSRYVKNDGDLVMIRYGASAAGKVFLIYNGAIANNMFQIKLITKELDIKFLYYYLSQTKIYNFLNSNGGSSTMPAITFGQIGAVKIPIPSLAEQERIVGILDKFEALVNDISVGIPAEIKARRKQYEYYRGKLLDFKSISNG